MYIPAGVEPDESTLVPLVVFLHGTNRTGRDYLWFRSDGPRPDLRRLADALIREEQVAPFVIAAPSCGGGASGSRSLWEGFSLTEFLRRAERSLPPGIEIDRSRIIVFGHSAAGCNPQGGLLRVASDVAPAFRPFAIIAIDTCLSEEGARILADTDPSAHVMVSWQTRTWPRAFEKFRLRFRRSSEHATPLGLRRLETLSVGGKDPHNDIVSEAIARSLWLLLPR